METLYLDATIKDTEITSDINTGGLKLGVGDPTVELLGKLEYTNLELISADDNSVTETKAAGEEKPGMSLGTDINIVFSDDGIGTGTVKYSANELFLVAFTPPIFEGIDRADNEYFMRGDAKEIVLIERVLLDEALLFPIDVQNKFETEAKIRSVASIAFCA